MNKGLKDRSQPAHNPHSADLEGDGSSEHRADLSLDSTSLQQLLARPFPAGHEEMMQRIRQAVRQATDRQLASGHPIYYGGTGAEAGRLYMRTPEGRRFEYRVLPDGSRETVRELPL